MRRITNEILGLNGLKRSQIFLRPIVMFLVTSQNFYGFFSARDFSYRKLSFLSFPRSKKLINQQNFPWQVLANITVFQTTCLNLIRNIYYYTYSFSDYVPKSYSSKALEKWDSSQEVSFLPFYLPPSKTKRLPMVSNLLSPFFLPQNNEHLQNKLGTALEKKMLKSSVFQY